MRRAAADTTRFHRAGRCAQTSFSSPDSSRLTLPLPKRRARHPEAGLACRREPRLFGRFTPPVTRAALRSARRSGAWPRPDERIRSSVAIARVRPASPSECRTEGSSESAAPGERVATIPLHTRLSESCCTGPGAVQACSTSDAGTIGRGTVAPTRVKLGAHTPRIGSAAVTSAESNSISSSKSGAPGAGPGPSPPNDGGS